MPRTLATILATVTFLLAGCASYRAEPLDREAEWERLQSVNLAELHKEPSDSEDPPDSNAPTFDYSDGLTGDEAAGLAVTLNPDLRAFRVEKQIAEGQLIQAGLLPNPEIELRWLTLLTGGASGGEINALFNITDALLTRKPRIERAHIRLSEIHWEVADREWRLASEVRLAVIDVHYLDAVLDLNRRQQDLLKRIVTITRNQRAAGQATELDIVLIEVEVADLQREARRLAGQRILAIHNLNGLIGLPPDYATSVQALSQPLAYEPVTIKSKQLAKQMRVVRPDLRQAEQAYLRAEKDLQIAVLRQVPDIAIGPAYERADGGNELGGALSAEIPVFDQNQGQIAVATAARAQKRTAYVALLHRARAELDQSLTRMATLSHELDFYFAEVVPRLKRSIDLTEGAFKAGELGVLPVLLQQRRVLDSQQTILESLRDYHRTQIEVQRTVGPAV